MQNLTDIKDTNEVAAVTKKRKSDEEKTSAREKILTYTLQSLLKLMKYDKEEFINTARFDKIYNPLVGQLSSILLLLFVHKYLTHDRFNGWSIRLQRKNI